MVRHSFSSNESTVFDQLMSKAKVYTLYNVNTRWSILFCYQTILRYIIYHMTYTDTNIAVEIADIASLDTQIIMIQLQS